MDSFAFHITLDPPKPWSEIAISWLSEFDFNAFEETENGIIAYTELDDQKAHELVKSKMDDWAKENNISVKTDIERIEQQNWNAVWESDFQPVNVEDKLHIIAPFHQKPATNGLVVEIQPQMSFGTGHHQTTWMMSKALLELDKIPESVLDMGTGTGILAILVEKLGAKDILAIDIEEWSADNTRENAKRNGCKNITTLHGDVDLIEHKKFGLILANINKNVLKSHMERYRDSLNKNGVLMLSGFFETDVQELLKFAESLGFVKQKMFVRETWAALQLELKK
jgi:ribosomal protein L11 methyltransferase